MMNITRKLTCGLLLMIFAAVFMTACNDKGQTQRQQKEQIITEMDAKLDAIIKSYSAIEAELSATNAQINSLQSKVNNMKVLMTEYQDLKQQLTGETVDLGAAAPAEAAPSARGSVPVKAVLGIVLAIFIIVVLLLFYVQAKTERMREWDEEDDDDSEIYNADDEEEKTEEKTKESKPKDEKKDE
ncbi:hypothetical protein JXA32_03325 [Candidatus Sumerlaeota bacterium]|nr:hypothetical protein [Candidatus Sumerlaeota bacterium]